MKILAIDDNKDSHIIIKALIKDAFPDALTLTALSGAQGLELAAAEDPDVILLDIIMPDIDGFKVCQKLKADNNLREIPVVFLTSLKGEKETRLRALEAGAEAFLAKPIDEVELIVQIRAMLKIKNANIEKRNVKALLVSLVEEQVFEIKETQTAMLNLLEDLTKENEARKKSEDALRESEERYRSVINASPDQITITDLEGHVLMASPMGLTMFGLDQEEVLQGRLITDFLVPEDRERALSNISLMFQGIMTGPGEYHGLRKDGCVFEIEVNSEFIRGKDGQPMEMVFVVRNITDRKHAEEKNFRQMEELLRWQEVTLGREDRNRQLKSEVNELLVRLGEAIRYPSQESKPPETDKRNQQG